MATRGAPARGRASASAGVPTLAVALQYRPGVDRAPAVVAVGRGALAARVAEAARQAGVPVLRQPELAGALARLEPGQVIPPELYRAVAQVLAFVWQLGQAEPPASDESGAPPGAPAAAAAGAASPTEGGKGAQQLVRAYSHQKVAVDAAQELSRRSGGQPGA